MRKLFLFMLTMLFSVSAYANLGDTFVVNGIKYYVDNEPSYDYGLGSEVPGQVHVTSNGTKIEGSITIPNKVVDEDGGTGTYNVTSIGSQAFMNCRKISSVTIENGLTSIDSEAFSGCTSLTSVTIPNSVTTINSSAFYGCSKLASVTFTLGSQLETIWWSAFQDCKSLTEITIPNSVTTIYSNTFCDCTKLTTVKIPDGVTKIDGGTFSGCTSLTSVTLPDDLITIDGNAFYGCTSLTTITIPDKVETIGGGAFNGCTSLTAITIPNSVESIGDGAFRDCTSLTSINIPSKVDKIDNNTFYGCSSLASIEIPDNVEIIGNGAFYNCTSLTKITIPNSVTTIGEAKVYYYDGAFQNCSKLAEITISDQLTTIGNNTFSGCTGLTKITIPSSVEIIGGSAFRDCSGILSITIPSGVTSIGDGAFSGCGGLKTVTSEIESPYEVSAFDWQSYEASLVVPQGARAAYKSANGWKEFAAIFEVGETVCPSKQTDEQGINYNLVQTDDNNMYYKVTGRTDALKAEIVIPSELNDCSVKTIESYAFSGCNVLTSVTIPNSVTSIGECAFNGCENIKVFTSEILEPFAVEPNVFGGWYYNATLVVPQGKRADYKKVSGWNEFAITLETGEPIYNVPVTQTDPQGIEYRLRQADDNSVYYTVTGRTEALQAEIVIPTELDGCPVKTIEDGAFNSCKSLTSITFLNDVKVMSNAFYACSSLKDVNVNVWDAAEFCNNHILGGFYNSRSYWDSEKQESVTINFTIHLLDKEGKDITNYVIPEGVTAIGDRAFEGCTSLTSVTIPNGVTSIGNNAFSGSTSLSEITIPSSVTSIGNYAFDSCTGIKVVTSKIAEPFEVNAFNWELCNNATLVVPEGKISAYKEVSGWNSFAFTIEEGQTVYDVPVEQTDDQGLTYRLRQGDDNSIYYSVTGHTEKLKADIVIPAELDGCPVRAIEGWLFNNCTDISSITFPNNELVIGEFAFNGCNSITTITFLGSKAIVGNGAFQGCYGLNDLKIYVLDAAEFCNNQILGAFDNPIGYSDGNTWKEKYFTLHLIEKDDAGNENEITDYVIPEGVTSIGKAAFKGYIDLSSITIPNSVTEIGDDAFQGCTGLSSVTIPNSVTSIGNDVFRYCTLLSSVKLGKNVRSIGDYAFFGCTSLESITLPKKLESIGDNAFSGEYSSSDYRYHGCPLTSISIPGSVKTIGNGAFAYCYNLVLVSFGTVEDEEDGGLTSIGDEAFLGCAFTSITLPNSVTTIGRRAFADNNKLTTAVLGDALKEIKDQTFDNCGALTSVTIPDGVTSIGERAFRWCYQLTSVIIPQSLISMGENVFEGCPLKSIDLPDGITAIPANLFQNNDLEYIKLGKNVKSIGKNAFGSRLDGDETMVVVEIGTSTPPAIVKDAFPNVVALSVINVIVPDAKAEVAYGNAAVWGEMTYANLDNNVVVTMTAEMAGDVGNEVLDQCGIAAAKVVGLKVKGIINADDFVQMKSNMKSLLRLDLSECDITAIPDGAMKGKTQLQELTLPTTLQTIGNSAFQGCPYLTGKLDLPAGVTSIGNSAFEGTNYTSVALPRSLKSIGDSAFYNLPIKQRLNIPESMNSIGAYAFAETAIYGHVTIPDGIEKIGDGAFRNTQISSMFLPTGITALNWAVFQGCSNLDIVDVKDNITSMYGYAFDGCTSLTNLRLSPNLTAMGEYALQNTNVDYVKVPSKVKVLSRGVFKNSKNLESLSLPAYLKTVGPEALYGCSGLRNLSVEAIEPPTVEKSSFVGVNTDKCLISLPTESYRAYRRAEFWGLFVQMRNDIAVQTEGNGEIAFEAVVEGEEEESLSRACARRMAAVRAKTRGSEGAIEPELTYANNGSSVYVPKGGQVNFLIIPGEGEMLQSAFLDGEDITAAVKDGVYTATADKASATLVVKFSGEAQEEGETEFIKITSAKQVPYCSSFDLDFTDMPDLKAYVATGYDKTKGTIWLTRVKQVPAETGFLLVGEAGDYNIPISPSAANTYYKNMFKGTIEGTTINQWEWMSDSEYSGEYTNYYLSKGTSGVGFYKVTNPDGQKIGANRCYLPIPSGINEYYYSEGDAEVIKVSAAKQVPYYTSRSIDFTNVAGVKAYTATGYNYTTGVIWLTRVMKVPAYTGVLVIADEAGEYSVPSAQIQSFYRNMFTGSEYEQTIYTTEEKDGIEYINYYLSNGASGIGFYKVTKEDGVKMSANRSYLQIPNRDTAAGARGMNGNASFGKMIISDNDDDVIAIPLLGGMIGDDEETTGIRNAQFEEAEPDAYYTLQGQRVENPRKGVYIKNGKKVVVK